MWNKRGDGYQPKWNLVQDDTGAPLGMAFFERQPMLQDIETIKKFLIHFKRQEQKEMGTTNEKTNMVWLAGTLKFDPKEFDNSVKCLIDVGMKSAVQVGVLKEKSNDGKSLADKLARFREKDFIKVIAIIEPFGVKQDDGTWKNGIAIRITDIKNEPPRRAEAAKKSDDEIPF